MFGHTAPLSATSSHQDPLNVQSHAELVEKHNTSVAPGCSSLEVDKYLSFV